MDSTQLEQLLARFDRLEDKVDRVRTEDLPTVKTDVAVLVARHKAQSKLHSFIGSVAAIIISAAMPHR
jgi:hypothetical protein